MKDKTINDEALKLSNALNARLNQELAKKSLPYVAILGAANLFLASKLTMMPSKAEAIDTAESCFDIIREAINKVPERMFGIPR